MNFSKILLVSNLVITGTVNGTEIAPFVQSPEEQQFYQIQDALKILPPIEKYLAKMENITEKYENVFKPLSEQECELRIKNAKEKTIKFYAEVFGVDLAEINKYSEKFTVEQYLAWVAKEIINNGRYECADDVENLFDAGLEKQPNIDFSQRSSDKYPKPKAIPDLYQIYVHLNDPYFESLIIHETGHVLEYAYRVLLGIKNETRDTKNWHMCEDAVSVFLETLYNKNNDFTFCLLRLSDFYRIKFKQAFSENTKKLGANDQENSPELYAKIESLSEDVSGYHPWERYEDHEKTDLPEAERTKNDSEENYRKYILQKYPEVKFVYDMWEEQMKKWGTTDLPISDRISDIGSVSWELSHFLDIYLGKDSEDLEDTIRTYANYVPHVYRTLKLADKLKSGEDVVNALDNIVHNVPKMMTKDEFDDFTKLLGLK